MFSFRHAHGVWRGFFLFDDLFVLYGGVLVPRSAQLLFTWTGTYLVAPLVQDSDVGKFIRPGKFLRESDIIISRVYVYAILYE